MFLHKVPDTYVWGAVIIGRNEAPAFLRIFISPVNLYEVEVCGWPEREGLFK